MRVLIISAFFVYAAAAPSGVLAPYAYSAFAVPAIVPTISSGDIQAAAIDARVQAQDYTIKALDAQVKAADLARASLDKAKEIVEQATENINEKSVNTVDLVNEKNVEAFWSAEDKKWQAVDALKTAQAQIDGAVASSAPLLAKSAVGVLPYVAAIAPSPYFAPVSPLVQPGFIQAPIVSQTDDKVEVAAKTAESTAAENSEEKAEKVEGEAVVKTSEIAVNENTFTQSLISPVGLTNLYRYEVVAPGAGPIFAQPLVNYAGLQPVHGVISPTFVKSVW